MNNNTIIIRDNLKEEYQDIYTLEAIEALHALAHFNKSVKGLMAERINRRNERQKNKTRITFYDPENVFLYFSTTSSSGTLNPEISGRSVKGG